MPINKNLNVSPYFDDYDETKNFSKILFKPSVPVQARELTQLQTILQNQVERFGDSVFTDGTIIKGCNFTFDQNYFYVKLPDLNVAGGLFDPSVYVGKIAQEVSSGLRAIVVNSVPGYASQNPDMNTIYVKYLNSGANGQIQFSNSSLLQFYDSSNTYVANVDVTVAPTAINGVNTNPVGSGYSFKVSSGVIFQKGAFIRVGNTLQTIVSKYSNQPNNVVVGFSTTENIVTYNQDSSLLDNASGFTNYNAPGADRLQLVPTLVTSNANAIANNFFTLVEWEGGNVVRSNQLSTYSELGKELAQRTYDSEGSFFVKPFSLASEPANTTHFNIVTSSGLAYIDGYRVEQTNNLRVPVKKGTDTNILTNQSLSTNYGNWILVNNFVGEFNSSIGATISLRDAAGAKLTSGNTSVAAAPGNAIGTAKIFSVQAYDGTPGTPTAKYRLFLADAPVMNAGQSFANVKSVFYTGFANGVADIVVDPSTNNSQIYDSNFTSLVFDTTKQAVKTLRNGANNDNVFIYRTVNETASFANTGVLNAITLSPPEQFPYSVGVLNTIQENSVIVVPQSTVNVTTTYTGTVAASNSSVNVTGTSTTFTTKFDVGDYININSQPRMIASIANDTFLTVQSAFTGASPVANTYAKCYVQNVPMPFINRKSNIVLSNSSSMSMTLYSKDLTAETLSATCNVVVTYDVLRNNVTQKSLNVLKNQYVKIDTALNILEVAPCTGNTTSSTVTGNGLTQFATDLLPGYLLYVQSNNALIGTVNAVTNNTSLTLTSNSLVAFTSNNILYSAPNSIGNLGPWTLGITGAYNLKNVYKTSGNTWSTSSVNDVTSQFVLSRGMKDAYYDLSSLRIKPNSPLYVAPGEKLTVVVDCFQDGGSGLGYYSIDSYPIDDVNTANTLAITTTMIPTYTSSVGTNYDLRNCLDFRPRVVSTGSYSNTLNAASVNPLNTSAFSGSNLYISSPNQLFNYSVTYYQGRIDNLILNSLGNFVISSGVPSDSPVAPASPSSAMVVSHINIPPYPSLTMREVSNNAVASVQLDSHQNKVYTMKAISSLDTRISELEYYTAFNLLETKTNALALTNANTGLSVFKNGIFVDQFTDFSLLETTNPEFRASIDPVETSINPLLEQFKIPMIYSSSSNNISKTGDLVTKAYTTTPFITQNTVTDAINCTDSLYGWNGTAYLYPRYDPYVDVTNSPVPISNTVSVPVPVVANTIPNLPQYTTGQYNAAIYSADKNGSLGGLLYQGPGSAPFSFYTTTQGAKTQWLQPYYGIYTLGLTNPWGAIFSGYITVPYTGTWTFTCTHDDGIELNINGTVLFSYYFESNNLTHNGAITLTGGVKYPFTMRYFENGRVGARLQLYWSEASTPQQFIPISAFSRDTVQTLPAAANNAATAGPLAAGVGSLRYVYGKILSF